MATRNTHLCIENQIGALVASAFPLPGNIIFYPWQICGLTAFLRKAVLLRKQAKLEEGLAE